jgi:hypothetical protein
VHYVANYWKEISGQRKWDLCVEIGAIADGSVARVMDGQKYNHGSCCMRHSCGWHGKASSLGSNPTTAMTWSIRRKLSELRTASEKIFLCYDISQPAVLACSRGWIQSHSHHS